MKSLTVSFTTALLLCAMTVNHVNAQELQPGDFLPEITPEEKAQRGASNSLAMAEVFILYAQEQGSSIAEAGRKAGKHFAKSWPEELTSEGFIAGMNNNWQMYGIKTEVLETDDDYIKARRDRIASEEAFERTFTVSLDDIETFFEYVQKEIASFHGLTYSEEFDGDSIVFMVSGS